MNSNFLLFSFLIIFAWLFTMSIFLWRALSHYNRLGRGVSEKNFKSIMETFLRDMDITKKDIGNLKTYYDKIQKESLLHIQKIGLVRFNPFKDTGGNQSFILSLVDGDDTGVIISCLHARSGMRWYAKRVTRGQSVDHQLSDEEKEALRKAKA